MARFPLSRRLTATTVTSALRGNDGLRFFVRGPECLKLDEAATALVFDNAEVHAVNKIAIAALHDVIPAARLNPFTSFNLSAFHFLRCPRAVLHFVDVLRQSLPE